MKAKLLLFAAGLTVAVTGMGMPAAAAGLLGVNIGGPAANSAAVNVGIGGDSLLSANTGGTLNGAIDTDATVLQRNGVAGVNANVGRLVDARAAVHAGAAGVCLGVLSSCGSNGSGIPDKDAADFSTARSAAGNMNGLGPECVSLDDKRAISIVQQPYNADAAAAWAKARSANIIPIHVCPTLRAKLLSTIKRDAAVGNMQRAAASDALISTVLQRSQYDFRNVLGVTQKGGTVSVFVF